MIKIFQLPRLGAFFWVVLVGAYATGKANAAPISLAEFYKMAPDCGSSVMPLTLASIAKTESGFEALALDDDTTGTRDVPTTMAEAAATVHRLIAAGDVVDVGLMQINSRNFGNLGLTVESALNACSSIKAAATLLSNSYEGGATHEAQQAALRAAISIYNTGDKNSGIKNGYVRKVESAAQQIVPAIDLSLKRAVNTSTSDQISKSVIDIWTPPTAAQRQSGPEKPRQQKEDAADAFELSPDSDVLIYDAN